MDLFKALIPGTILTLVVCGIMGSNHQTGDFLNIFHVVIKGVSFYWSWPLFIVSTGLAWALFAMTPE
jgi:hypothetical protein